MSSSAPGEIWYPGQAVSRTFPYKDLSYLPDFQLPGLSVMKQRQINDFYDSISNYK